MVKVFSDVVSEIGNVSIKKHRKSETFKSSKEKQFKQVLFWI